MPQNFDFPDPFGVNARFADPFRDPFGGPRRQPAAIQPLPAPEQESALSKLGQAALGGLGWIGETLDKTFGGRAVRGLLGGKPEEALSLIPFSDTLGITNPENAVSGKELLGFDKHDDSWGGFGAGLGAEILLDPSTYLTLGGSALSKLGRGAEKIGTLPRSLAARARGFTAGSAEAAQLAQHLGVPAAEVAGRPLGGAAKLGIPFTDIGTILGGEAPARAIDAAKDYLAYSKAGRVAAPLFDSSLHTFGPSPTTEAAQRAVRAGTEGLEQAKPNILLQHFDDVKRLEDAGMKDEAATLRQLIEKQFQGPQTPGIQAAGQVAGDIGQRNERMLAEALDLGIPKNRHVSDFGVEYATRQMTPDVAELLKKTASKDKSFAQVRTPDAIKRISELDVPGGTETINDLLRDPAAVARGTPQQIDAARQYALSKLGYDPTEHATLQAMNGGKGPSATVPGFQPGSQMANPDFQRWQQLEKLQQSGNFLADWAGKLPDEFRTANNGKGMRFFGNSPLGDATQYALNHAKATEGARAWYDIIGNTATPAYADGAKSVAELLHQKNTMFGTTANATTGALQGSMPQVWQRLEQKGLVSGPMPQKLGDVADIFKNIFVPGDVSADLQRFGQSFAMPENLNPLLKGWDYATNLTKAGQILAPAFNVRNRLSGIWQNVVGNTGATSDLVKGNAGALRSGAVLPDANTIRGLTNLSPADATRRIKELAYAYGARVPQERSLANELMGRLPHDSGMAGELGTFAGRQDKPLLQSVREALPSWLGGLPDATNAKTGLQWDSRWNPLNPETFAPFKANREISGLSDDLSRSEGFLGLLRQGFDPRVAAEKVNNLHFGGNVQYAPFEREVMRRLVPFYGWSRQNLPFQLQQLAEKPGGLTAQAMRATGEMRQQDGMLPDWIGEGMAIPVGAREGNSQRYLSSFGLPFEDIARFVNTGASPVQRTMQEVLGQLNPLLKGPLEYATGMQFYSGRQTPDLYARSGNPLVDQVIMNSPLSRAFGLGSQLIDPRKGLTGFATNLASPFHVTDVDMERAQAVRERQILDDALRRNPAVRQFVDFYVPREQVPNLDPQTLEQLRLYRTLVDQAKARNKATH